MEMFPNQPGESNAFANWNLSIKESLKEDNVCKHVFSLMLLSSSDDSADNIEPINVHQPYFKPATKSKALSASQKGKFVIHRS